MAAFKRLGAMYGRLGLQTPGDLVERRIVAATAVLGQVVAERIPILVRVAFGLAKPEECGFLVRGFSDADTTFHLLGDEQEVGLLATAVLAEIVEAAGALAPTCALAIATASFGGVRSLRHDPGLASRAAECLADAQVATAPTERRAEREGPDIDAAVQAIRAATTHQSVASLSANTASALEILAEHYSEADRPETDTERALSARVRSLEAEVRLQWWVTSRWSNEVGKPFRDMAAAAAGIVAGVELAERGGGRFGAGSAPAMLDMVLGASDRTDMHGAVTLAAAVLAPTRDWRRKWTVGVAASANSALVPVTLAMALAAESEDEDDWLRRFSRIASLDAASEVSPMNLARQVYLETLLKRRCAIGDA